MTTPRNDDIARRRAEAAALLDLDADNMSPATILRAGVASPPRAVMEAGQGKSARSPGADFWGLTAGVGALPKILPARPLERPGREITADSARQRLLQTVLAV